MKTIKPFRMWMITNDTGSSFVSSIAFTKKESIEKFKKDSLFTWDQLKSYGWKCVKITITTNEAK